MIVVRRSRPRDPERVQLEMEAVFRTLLAPGRAVTRAGGSRWRPPIEVFETADALVVRAEIAGMDEGQLEVVIDGDLLSIRGERPDPRQSEPRSYHESRIPYGAFGADVYIPFAVEADRADADYRDGFLRIVLPRATARTIIARQPSVDGGR
jgi:HSP20 family protein